MKIVFYVIIAFTLLLTLAVAVAFNSSRKSDYFQPLGFQSTNQIGESQSETYSLDTLKLFQQKKALSQKENDVVFFYDLVIKFCDFSKADDSDSPGILISEAVLLLLKQFKF